MKLLGRWHQLAIKAQDVFSTQVLSIHYYYTRMNKADWFQIGFPLAVTVLSPTMWCEKVADVTLLQISPEGSGEHSKGHTVGLRKQVRGDLVLTPTLSTFYLVVWRNWNTAKARQPWNHILITDCDESLVSICKDFLWVINFCALNSSNSCLFCHWCSVSDQLQNCFIPLAGSESRTRPSEWQEMFMDHTALELWELWASKPPSGSQLFCYKVNLAGCCWLSCCSWHSFQFSGVIYQTVIWSSIYGKIKQTDLFQGYSTHRYSSALHLLHGRTVH